MDLQFRLKKMFGSRSAAKPRAFSLVEAILASFLLLTAVIMSVSVFDSSLQAEASNEMRIVGALVAETAMAEVRQDANRDLSQVSALYDGKTWTYPQYPGFRVTSRVRNTELAIPCTVLESQYNKDSAFPEPTGRYLDGSTKKVEVSVTWQDGGSQAVNLTENVCSFSPVNDLRLQILLPGGAVAAAGTVVTVPKQGKEVFGVRAISGGTTVPDLQYSWVVQPLTGHGSILTVSRDGTECEYINEYRNFDDKKKYAPGTCDLVVTATFQGRERQAKVRIDNEK